MTRSTPGNASGSATGSNTVTRQPAAAPERGERTGDRGGAGDPEQRGGQMRFHVDLQGATGVAGHDQFDDAVAPPTLGGCVLAQAEQPRLAVRERSKRLADDDGLGAAAADPALDRAVRMDEAGRPGSRRRRPPDRDDRGDHEGPPGRLEFGGADEDGPSGHDALDLDPVGA